MKTHLTKDKIVGLTRTVLFWVFEKFVPQSEGVFDLFIQCRRNFPVVFVYAVRQLDSFVLQAMFQVCVLRFHTCAFTESAVKPKGRTILRLTQAKEVIRLMISFLLILSERKR